MARIAKNISKTRRPKMSMHRGRTWDCWELIMPDGLVSEAWLDTTWGEYFYFRVVEKDEYGHDFHQWYSGRIYDYAVPNGCCFDLRTLQK